MTKLVFRLLHVKKDALLTGNVPESPNGLHVFATLRKALALPV